MKTGRRYFWAELGFLLFISFAISLISDLEYSVYEEHDISKFSDDQGYRIVTGLLSLFSYSIFYWGILKKQVFRRSVWGVVLCSLAFVVLDHLFDKHIGNWIIAHSDIVSASLRKRALKDMHDPRLIFTFNYALISTIFPLTGLAFLVRSLTQDEDLKALKEQQLVAELNYLKAQLQPHFFFNTINNIYGLALKQSADTAPMVARLGEMMRYILYEADRPQVPLTREVDFLADYIAVEKMRYPQRTDIRFDVQGLQPGQQIAPLLLLPFIENAFKHGLQEETQNGYIHIVICRTEDELTLQVSNSKPQSPAPSTTEGIGLKNARQRLNRLYPGKHRLEVNDLPDSYEVTLVLPNV